MNLHQRQRIVMLGTAFDTKGGVSSVVNVYRAAGLFEQWPIEYIATHRDGSKFSKLSQAIQAMARLLTLLVTRRVSLMHVHTASGPSFWRKSIYFALARLCGVPWILHLHGGHMIQFYENAGSTGRWLIRTVFHQSAGIIALSEHWKHWVEGCFCTSKVQVIANPVSISDPTEFHLRESGSLLFLGQFGHNKGIYLLLTAIEKLAGEFPNLKLWAGGDGELEQVRVAAERLGIADRISILGWVNGEAKANLLAKASIYVLPSYAEAMPMSVLEAMAAGLPIVSTPVGGIPSAVRDGIEGRLVPPGDVEQLTDALRELLLNPELGRRMGQAARQTAVEKFSAARVIKELGAIYRRFDIQPINVDIAFPQVRTQSSSKETRTSS